ncbi:unnamed protein product [Microthlaspi erraticum]|uniref:Uncharacterized protein n=1 Tax=Microthlaspi erraticum TaxID=1685480 RepID=A0A6D2K264_9BRAS|nr:unnamed protein product [Microthlaspi erraticum]
MKAMESQRKTETDELMTKNQQLWCEWISRATKVSPKNFTELFVSSLRLEVFSVLGACRCQDGGIACGEFDDGGSEFRVVSLFAGSVGSLHLVKSSGGRWCEEAWGWRVLCQIH